MFNKNITIEDVNFVLRKQFEGTLETAYSDHNSQRLVLRIRMKFAQDPLDDLNSIKTLQNKVLTSVLIRGLPGLKSVSFRKLDEIYAKNPTNDNRFEPVEQFVLDTLGTNFLDVIIHPDVDGLRLISNHVHDMYDNLGIEAARAILFKEIFGLFEQAAPVNYRHVALLVDAICNRGRMMSADRYGVNKKKTGPLAKASFEQTEEIMLRAALFGEMDPVTGVSANIMTGQPIRGGTSFTNVLLDESALQAFIATAPPGKKSVERAPALGQKQITAMLEKEGSAGCRQEDLRIPAALPAFEVTGDQELPDMEITLVDE
jgi:DNA-directed RNA polymerase II subunit RPB1